MFRPNSSFAADHRCPSAQSNMTSELSHDDAKNLLESSRQRWSLTHDQLRTAILERTMSPMSQMEQQQNARNIAALQQSLAKMEAEMAHYKEELKRAETTIVQQRATIRTQSKAIENPRSGRDFQPTPYHLRSSQDTHGMGPAQRIQPPAFNIGRLDKERSQDQYSRPFLNASEASFRGPSTRTGSNDMFGSHSTGHTPNSKAGSSGQGRSEYEPSGMHRNAPLAAHDAQFGPSNQAIGSQYNWQVNTNDPFAPSHPFLERGVSRNNHHRFFERQEVATPESIITNPYLDSAVRPSSNPMLCPAVADREKIGQLFSKVFDMTQQYARTHANFPSTAGDNALPKETKEKLLKAATNTTAFNLMSDWQTRYFLVAKLMLQWIIKHILRFNAFSGLDQDIDNVISGSKAAIYQSTPPQIRFLLLANVANEIKKLRQRPDFDSYVQHLSEQRAQKLLQMVRPMMHQSPIGEREDLITLLREAHCLAEIMFAGTDEFSFDFHPVGCSFEIEEMTKVESATGEYRSHQQRAAQPVIRLGTTPIVRIRRNAADGVSREQILVKARVLLKG